MPETPTGASIRAEALTKVFKGAPAPAVDAVDLHVDDEEQVGVAGRHGRGPQGSITIEPVVSRPARSRWTCCASASG